MDIDAMRGPEWSEEKKKELMAANACFYCQKKGHRAKDCFKKKRDRGENPTPNLPAKIKAAEELSKEVEITPEMLTKYFESSTFLNQSDEEKLNLLEKLSPGF